MGKQSTLFNFFAKVDKTTNQNKPRSKYKLGVDRVLKKVADAKIPQDDDEEGEYVPPVFVTGRVKEFHPATGDSSNSESNSTYYTIEFESPTTTTNNSNDASPSSESGASVAASPSSSSSSEQWKESDVEYGVLLHKSIGTKIAKYFDDEIFNGHVADVTKDTDNDNGDSKKTSFLYHVSYDDGDAEDLSDNEFEDCKKLYQSQQQKKKKKNAKPQTARKTTTKSSTTATKRSSSNDDDNNDGKRKKSRVSYKEDDSDDLDITDDDDDEEFDDVAGDDYDDDDVSMDDDMSVESFEDKKPAAKKTKKATAKTKETSNKGKGGKRKKKDKSATPEDIMKEFEERVAKVMKKEYKPNNNPQKWPASGDFVEPVGMDPTNGIIEGIIAAQVQKVAGLLQLVKESNSDEELMTAGELRFPIKLQTACSGTDAPSIALELIQESFDKMCPDNSLKYEHLMSCEIEPFKQSYIHR